MNPYFTIPKLAERTPIVEGLHTDYAVFKPIGYSPETGKVALECHAVRTERGEMKRRERLRRGRRL